MPPGTSWTRARYVRFLRATLAVIDRLDPAIAVLLPDIAVDVPRRADRLRADLRALGDDAGVGPATGPDLGGRAAAFGAAYVVEGSMLGGQHVARALERDLALDAASLSYLRPRGVAIGIRWKAFVEALDAFGASAPVADWRAAEAAADTTFTAFAEAFRREGLI